MTPSAQASAPPVADGWGVRHFYGGSMKPILQHRADAALRALTATGGAPAGDPGDQSERPDAVKMRTGADALGASLPTLTCNARLIQAFIIPPAW